MTPALGYYLWPARWVGAAPPNAVAVAESDKLAGAKLDDVILEVALPEGVRSRVHRDGMVAYDFGSQPGGDDAKPRELFAAYERRVRVINAHLACLKASFTTSRFVAPATGETVLGIEYDPSDAYAFSGGVLAAAGEVGVVILSLSRARLEPPTPIDWRFTRMGPPITRDEIKRSYALLRRLLKLDEAQRDDALLHAELLVRAQAALSVDDRGGALIYAWTAAEGMLRSRFAKWVDAQAARRDAGRDQQGNQRVFLDSKRRKELIDGRDMTVWHMAELGSLAGWLPFDLYRNIRTCGSARNAWLHSQKPSALQHAPSAIRGTQELFKLVYRIDLRDRDLHSTA